MKLTAIKRLLATNTIDSLKSLFVELGWDRPQAQQMTTPQGVDSLLPIAQKRGYMVFVAQCATMPDKSGRNDIEHAIFKQRPNKLVIFVAGDQRIWQFSTRDAQRKRAIREFSEPNDTTMLATFLARMEFGLDQEESLTLVDVLQLLNPLAEVERVTKRFYDEFKRQHDVFMNFIAGIPDEQMQRWYASVMLNRLMFIYFLQKKQFVAGDVDYLKKNLEKHPENYYQQFLSPLFFEGFAKRPEERSPEAKAKLGNVPYLNGGIFNQHQIEQLHGQQITIADEAFQKIFAFFDGWTWHLDDRPLRANSNEINPDVLGYIFEKYINQRQMGAYYTKEDITEYICRSTIVPFLLDIVVTDADWQMLADDPERYIFVAVRQGLELPLPAHIAAGITDVSKRGPWNTQADEAYKLPTEIWRETVARRQRAEQLIARMKAGEIRTSNQLITDNLDVRQLLQDVIARADSAHIMTLWQRLQTLSVLDPTVGSGAFLFAALNILKPIYDACLDRMAVLRADGQLADHAAVVEAVLSDIKTHKSQTYTVLKRIMIHNLYGVDIMEEAVEICKLRLFLKLTAQITDLQHLEPLPDIDFNIRAGNTLVGYARLQDAQIAVTNTTKLMDLFKTEDTLLTQLEELSLTAKAFRDKAQDQGAAHSDKLALMSQLAATAEVLNLRLADAYKVDVRDASAYKEWKTSHRPFHWCSEFYEITEVRGGFDVIVGNPPYVVFDTVHSGYDVIGYKSYKCMNLYGYCMERISLLSYGRMSLIVPLSVVAGDKFAVCRELVSKSRTVHWSHYDIRPSKLFDGVDQRLTIFISSPGEQDEFSSKYNRWGFESRVSLFQTISYSKTIENNLGVAKISEYPGNQLMHKIFIHSHKLSLLETKNNTGNQLIFRSAGGRYYLVFFSKPQNTYINGKQMPITAEKPLYFPKQVSADAVVALASSTLFYWFYLLFSDARNLTKSQIGQFCFPNTVLTSTELQELGVKLQKDLNAQSIKTVMNRKNGDEIVLWEIYPKKSKHIIDEIDRVLAQHYGFTDEELDYIINYDIKYRMGLVDGAGDSDEEE